MLCDTRLITPKQSTLCKARGFFMPMMKFHKIESGIKFFFGTDLHTISSNIVNGQLEVIQ